MDRFFFDRCRASFIRKVLRLRKQERMDFDAELRMRARVRIGNLFAIQWPDDFSWTVWKEGNRGYLIVVERRQYRLLSDAMDYIKAAQQNSVVAKVD
jgi:hypothetical protein